MPSSLRWLAALLALSVAAAVAGGAVLYVQARARTQTMAEAISGGHVDAGQAAIARYGCGSCHEIPGIAGATGKAGPALAGMATRTAIAGVLVNDPPHLIAWLRRPQAILPGNGMPDQGVTESDARDMAAYLYTLKR